MLILKEQEYGRMDNSMVNATTLVAVEMYIIIFEDFPEGVER